MPTSPKGGRCPFHLGQEETFAPAGECPLLGPYRP